MNESSPEKRCPTCGSVLPPVAPGGLCPKCLLLNVAAATEPDPAAGSGRPAPPSIEQVAAAFPQLDILEFIGQGGMGCVFKARQPQLNRVVALKILPESRAHEAAFADRFAREARALAALNHPNIVTVHDFGQSGGFFYLLMEFVDGLNLRQLMRERKLTPEEALAIVPPLCDALQFAHERGIVHRDIKPENLLLDRAGRVKIADFGIAKMFEPGGPPSPALPPQDSLIPATPSGPSPSFVAGTPGYMAPEQQASPHRVDSRADIYSLGVVLYEMLTGELPADTIQPPSRKVQIDVRLDEIVLRALEKTPELRFQTAAELRTQVDTIVTSPPAPPATPPPPLQAKRQRKGEFLGVGAAVQALGLALCFVRPYGWIPGLVLLLIGGRMALRLICSHCGNSTTRHARQCAACGASFQADTRTAGPDGGWRRAGRALFVVALLATVNFATPHYSPLGDGTTRVWTVGLIRPWITDIERVSSGGPVAPGAVVLNREVRMSFDRFSFLCGFIALAAWILLIRLQRREHHPGLAELVRPGGPGAPPHVHWGSALGVWVVTTSIIAIATLLILPLVHVWLQFQLRPAPALVVAVALGSLATALAVLRSRWMRPRDPRPTFKTASAADPRSA